MTKVVVRNGNVDGALRMVKQRNTKDGSLKKVRERQEAYIKKGVKNGAGEIVVNSIDTDGVKKGFDIEMLKAVCEIVNVPVIASGGAGKIEDFVTLFKTLPKVDAGLAASIFHFGEVSIKDLKNELYYDGINVRR